LRDWEFEGLGRSGEVLRYGLLVAHVVGANVASSRSRFLHWVCCPSPRRSWHTWGRRRLAVVRQARPLSSGLTEACGSRKLGARGGNEVARARGESVVTGCYELQAVCRAAKRSTSRPGAERIAESAKGLCKAGREQLALTLLLGSLIGNYAVCTGAYPNEE
jgi:hypothetical protein